MADDVAWQTGWTSPQSCSFVLTGRAPAIDPVQVTVTTLTGFSRPITLIAVEAYPWISAQTRERAFRQSTFARDQRRGHGRGRAPGPGRYELFAFVFVRREAARERQSYPAIHRQWKEEHPDSKIGEWRTLRKLYLLAADELGFELAARTTN